MIENATPDIGSAHAPSRAAPVHPSFGEAFRTFGRIGLLSFGGPAGQIALMHRVLVEEKRWLDETRFLHALNYCMLLPGPEAMQLATYAGWLLHGVKGGLAAGLLFVLPGAAVLMALSAAYFFLGDVPLVAGLLFGLKAAVLALVVEALIRVAKRALKGSMAYPIAAAAFAGIAFLALPFPLVIAAAALWGTAARLGGAPDAGGAGGPTLSLAEQKSSGFAGFAGTTLLWLAIWFLPLVPLALALGVEHVLVRQAIFFSQMAVVTFGGAYAVLAYVGQEAVATYGWLGAGEMITGLGLAETTPGPLILVLMFVGFLGAARQGGFDPLTGGIAGALVTLWFTFAPCFLFIFAGAPFIERVRNVQWLRSALAGVSAAVVGVIASLALWFGLHVLFAEVGQASAGPFAWLVPELGSFDPAAAAIAMAAGVALLRFHVNLFAVLGAAALAGMALRLLL
ncbi:MAG TPA: chromate efflux transporter [Mesorhizobium sp.]|jgi:chromate transporter|nr:chromate efflux transporter [Mesorhizobium sp.]